MTLPYSQPIGEMAVIATAFAIGASSTTAALIAPCKGRIQRTGCTVISGTATGATATISVKVTPSGTTAQSADIGALIMPVGAGLGTATEDWPSPTGASVYVNDGDLITFTPVGGTGAS